MLVETSDREKLFELIKKMNPDEEFIEGKRYFVMKKAKERWMFNDKGQLTSIDPI